jgi:polysaccharide biosynthesis protein PslG
MNALSAASLCFVLIGTACLLTADDSPPKLSPFGIGSCHINNRSVEDFERWMPQMQAIGLHNYRSCATGWGQVEPEKGKFVWANLDAQLDYLAKANMPSGGILIGCPRWNELDAPGSLPVNNLQGWSNYVREIVKHCKGRIHRWEVWNEPPNFTGKNQTPADYAKIVVSAYAAAKAANPNCMVGLAAKSAHINYLEQVILAGAKDHFDYITLHPYEILDGIASDAGNEAIFMNIVPCVRRMLAAQNPAKKDVPIIFTELGCDVGKGAEVQAHTLIKAYTMGIAQGVESIHWFEGRDGDSGPLGLIDKQGKPRPAYTALQQMIKHLGQHPEYLGWYLFNDKHYAFAFRGSSSSVVITWTRPGIKMEIESKNPKTAVNPITGVMTKSGKHQITTAPLFLLSPLSASFEQAKANRGKPLPWDGDFTSAQSVSISYDPQPIEKGLHTLSGTSVAKAVLAYGGSARAGNVPGGNLFVVDPTFISYESTPIEITAVVRRNEKNDNAGFKLVYESKSGFKTAEKGWFTIPDNKDWHTVRWKITDPQFNNYWGYNFSLVSDGDTYNKYYLQSVTVTKLPPRE